MSQTTRTPYLPALAMISIFLFVLSIALGKYGPVLVDNAKCFTYLGCNVGFFGYDALEHFLSGIMEATLILWVTKKHSQLNIFNQTFWKNFVIIVSIIVFLGFCWEIGELAHDQFRIKVLHENLYTPNHLDQPSNDDTMGDMSFNLLGAAATTLILKAIDGSIL